MRLSLIFLLFPLMCFAQEYKIGELRRNTIRYFDVQIPNTTEQSKYIVKVEHSPQVVYRVDRNIVQPDSAMTLRIQVNPDTIGPFLYKLKIQLSNEDEPREFVIRGNAVQLPSYKTSDSYQTPAFVKETRSRPEQSEFHVKAVDPRTGNPLPGATISIISNGKLKETWQMDHRGEIRRKYDEQFLFFVISYPGYETTEAGIFLDDDIYEISIPVSRSVDEPPPPPGDTTVRDQQLLSNEDARSALDTQLEENPPRSELKGFCDTVKYQPANIVFVLDISESMRSREKLELMKFAMNQLVDNLRPVDRITVLTYGEKAELYIPSTSGSEKEMIKNRISELEATGKSSSGKGIQMAYKKFAVKADPRFETMVVVLTDGAFNKDSDKITSTVKKYLPRGITFSVVGIQERNADRIKMQHAASIGNGLMVEIKKLSDAQHKLLDMVMTLTSCGH